MKVLKYLLNVPLVFAFFFSFFTLVLNAQVDSVMVYNANREYSQNLIDSLLNNMKIRREAAALQKIFDANKNLKGKVELYRSYCSENYMKNEYDSVVYFANLGIEHYKNMIDKRSIDGKIMVPLYNLKGRALRELKDYKGSIVSYQNALEFEKKYPYKWRGFIITGLAGNHLSIGNDSIALSYFLEVSKDTLYMDIPRSASFTYNSIGTLFQVFNKNDLAKKYYRNGIKNGYETKYLDNVHSFHYNLGSLMLKESKIDSALYHFKKGSAAADEFGMGSYSDGPLYYRRGNGFIALHTGDYDDAITQFRVVLDSINLRVKKNKVDKELYNFCSQHIAEAYKKKGDFLSANQVLKANVDFLNEYHKEELNTEIQKLEMSYQSKVKDVEISTLEAQNEAKNTIIQQRAIITWSIVGLFVLGGVLTYLFYRKRQSDQKYRLASVEQRLLRSQLNPHFLFNALNSIVSLASIKSDKTIPYTLKLSTLLRSILQNSREEFVTLSEELSSIEDYMELESNFSERFSYQIQIDKDIDTEEVLIPPMFIQPFIENSIKHGFRGEQGERIELSIKLAANKKSIYCSIIDNGLGYTKSKQINKESNAHKSLSGKILQERLTHYSKAFKTNAFYEINDGPKDIGTQVYISLPYLLDT